MVGMVYLDREREREREREIEKIESCYLHV